MKKIVVLLFITGIIVFSYYFIFSKKKFVNNNPISDIFVSDDQKLVNSLTDKEIQKAVFYALPDFAIKPLYNGKVFCSDKLYGYDYEVKSKTVNAYLYAYCEEYYLKNDKPVLGNAINSAMKFIFTVKQQKLNPVEIIIPKSGDEYQESLKSIFTNEYYTKANEKVEPSQLVPSPNTQAQNYYKGKLEVYF